MTVIRIEIIIPENNVRLISEALKKIGVGGITVLKVKGRGKTQGPQIHASKGTELFTPEFSDKYVIHVIVPQEKETDVIRNCTVKFSFWKDLCFSCESCSRHRVRSGK